ncbi:motile sperm domain-containing protein 1-like isoform X2 [Bacillus rossius redtenbacheri]|uniref:motile sperm domain-containing protein 1-like isoform X2 n=1 Tax=Bacillus rossius redtenbacheri TaxID=93214 RepID=UPI002FDDC1F9
MLLTLHFESYDLLGISVVILYGMQPGLVQVPVFVYPTPITFYLEDQASHKQVLTLYNPYEFAIRFRVLCTAPSKYTVVDPEGSIRPHCCIDIVVRHNAVYPGNCNVTDKFRVEMQNHATKQVIGKQVVAATLLPGKQTGAAPEPDVFQNLAQQTDAAGAPAGVQHQFGLARDYRHNRLQTPNHVAIITAVVCIGALLLPTQGEQDSRFPSYLHLTPHLKLVFAYVLGMVTMVVLKPI